MGAVNRLIENEKIPHMLKVRQFFNEEKIHDFEAALRAELLRGIIANRIKPGMRVAITAGSRGIDHMPEAIRILGSFIQARGAYAFVIPAMGSHGGATAEGQRSILESYGITEESVGLPIHATMETVALTSLDDGAIVYIDRYAAQADGVVVLNRIKAHTGFRAPYESGLMKMMAVGLGKQKGAETVHSYGPLLLGRAVERVGGAILKHAKILFGVGLVENAYDQCCIIRCLTPSEIVEDEPNLLELSKSMMAKLYFENLDILIVDRIGKNISGSGMDPNITKNYAHFTGLGREGKARRIVVFDLTDETLGCAVGVGGADITTRRLLERMDFDTTYPNCLTSGEVESPCIPMVFDNQELAVKGAIKSLAGVDKGRLRIARIRDTLHLGEIEISEAMRGEAGRHAQVEILSDPAPWIFNQAGDLF